MGVDFQFEECEQGNETHLPGGDKLSNLRELDEDYANLGDAVWERFNQKDKEMHAWYYRELLKILEETFTYEFYQETEEFSNLIDNIFG